MFKYILKRLLATVITLWAVITITFAMMHALPGNPFLSEKALSPTVLHNMEAKYGLDKPLIVQYGRYFGNLLHFDFGLSTKYEGRSVLDMINYSFPASAKIGGLAVLIAIILGIYLGTVSALHQGKWQDGLVMVLATLGITVPSFVLAILMIYLFAVKLSWLPATGFDGPSNYVMPVIALSASSTAYIARLTRSSLLDVIRQDYIRTAKAKGLSENVVTFKHALRNSLIPVITYVGPLIAAILTGSFVIETIFGIPGLGREFVTSISNRDTTMIVGVTVFYSTFLILCNLTVDILYVIIDPRIKLD